MTIDPSPLTTTLEHITEQLSNVGQMCDAWGSDAECSNKPTWQLQVRHTSPPTPGCAPVTCLLCDACRAKAYEKLLAMGPGPFGCVSCRELGLLAPISFVLSEVRI